MKLHVSILQQLISLPTTNLQELRQLLDDIGVGDVKDVLGDVFTDAVFNIETLANRGDHLSALGVARQLSARLLTPLKYPAVAPQISDRKAGVPVRITTDLCSRYGLLEMNVPPEMQLRSDVAAVIADADPARHALVHLLNYILLELGQPMHAFDRDKIDGELIVEKLAQATTIEALDAKTYNVPAGAVVIRDRKKVVAVAGVIGCANSMLTADTTRVFVESACFDPVSIRLTARAMGISTDASYTFERGSDIELVALALRRLSYLSSANAAANALAQVVGFTLVEQSTPERAKVRMNLNNLRKQLHAPRLEMSEVQARLKNLGYVPDKESTEKELLLTVPSWRVWDVKNEADLIEDFAYTHGLNRIRLELPPLDYEIPEDHPHEQFLRLIEPALIGQGFFEVITKGFYSRREVDALENLSPGISDHHLAIQNAVERNYSHLKITNILHLGMLAERNHRQGVLSCKVYEFGRLFSKSSEQKKRTFEFERDTLTLGFSGRWYDNEWKKPESLDEKMRLLKGVIDSIARSLGLTFDYSPDKNPWLHPGYQSLIRAGRERVGTFGLVHPQLQKTLELSDELLYAELEVEALEHLLRKPLAAELCEYPSIRRDLTLRLPLKSYALQTCKAMLASQIDNLIEVTIVDDFKRPEEDFRRTSFRLTFRNQQKTLASSEVDQEMQKLLNTLKEKHEIELA